MAKSSRKFAVEARTFPCCPITHLDVCPSQRFLNAVDDLQ